MKPRAYFPVLALAALLALARCGESGPPDENAPVFAGLEDLRLTAPDYASAELTWQAAADDVTPSGKIVYDVCWETSYRECTDQFKASFTTEPGATSFTVVDLEPFTTYFSVVHARDREGNRDSNKNQKNIRTPPRPSLSPWRWEYPIPQGNDLHGVWAIGDELWAVGDCGTIVRRRGGAWEVMQASEELPDLRDIHGTGPRNVWAVGDGGAIFRFDGERWVGDLSGTGTDLNGVWVVSERNVYAVGGSRRSENGTVLHYDGDRWSRVEIPTTNALYKIAGSPSGKLFAVGEFGTTLSLSGTKWAGMRTPLFAELNDVWVLSDREAYIVGTEVLTKGVVFRFDGTRWSEMEPEVNDPPGLNSVTGTSGTDIWIATDKGTILQFDGKQWSTASQSRILDSLWAASPTQVFGAGLAGEIGFSDRHEWKSLQERWLYPLNSVSGGRSNDLLAVGKGFTVIRYDGTRWTKADPFPEHFGSVAHLNGVWGDTNGFFAAVGSSGKILMRKDGAWVEENGPTAFDLGGVWGSDSGRLFAVGRGGTILHYDGGRWMPQSSPTSKDLYDVWGLGAEEVYAVGDEGVILRYGGSGWDPMNSMTPRTLTGIIGGLPNLIWAVGQPVSDNGSLGGAGVALRFDGAVWSEVEDGAGRAAVIPVGQPETVIVVGGTAEGDRDNGFIRRFDGTKWLDMKPPTRAPLLDILQAQGGDLIVVGGREYFGSAVVLRYRP